MKPSISIEELLGPVAAQPRFEPCELRSIAVSSGKGHLACPERPLCRLTVQHLWTRPAARGTQHQHGPRQRPTKSPRARGRLDVADPQNDLIETARHERMHLRRIVSFDEMRVMSVPVEDITKPLALAATQDCEIGPF